MSTGPSVELCADPRRVRFGYSEAVMSRRRQHLAWKMIAASALLFTLLLALLPHPNHLTIAAVCPVLAIVFLFGTVPGPCSVLLPSQVSDEHPPQSPEIPSLFQRPPPVTT
jgi:hypothetical protein